VHSQAVHDGSHGVLTHAKVDVAAVVMVDLEAFGVLDKR